MSAETNELSVVLGTDEAEQDIALGIGIDLKAALKQVELHLVRIALGQAKGNVSLAARLLKLNRTTLHEKMRRHAI